MEIKVRNIVAGSLSRRIGYPVGTRLPSTVLEFVLKNDELENPLVNFSHIPAMGLATRAELEEISRISLEVNRILANYMREIQIELIDFKLEFGRYQGRAAGGGRDLPGHLPLLGLGVPMSRWTSTGSGGTWAMWSRPTRRCCTA